MTVTEVESRELEIVETPTVPAEVGHEERRTAAIERAAEAAMAMPGMPGRDEFLTLAMTARMLSMSGAAPEAVRNSPYVAFHVAMVGRDLGISPSAAIEQIDVIPGKNGAYTLSLSPQLLNGQIRRLGLGSIRPRLRTNEACVAVAYDHEGNELGESEFTWEDARMAGLVGEDCEPGAHVEKTITRNSRSWKACGCNQGYKTYPKRMLWWRASGFAADDFFPEAGLGLYTAEELGAIVDHTGRAVDPATVELPEGYEPAAIGGGEQQATPEMASGEDLFHLQLRIRALPHDEMEDLRAKWKQMKKLAGYPAYRLSEEQRRLADSLVTGLEKRAKSKHGYDAVEAQEAIREEIALHVIAVVMPAWSSADGSEPPEEPNPGSGGEPAAETVEGPESASLPVSEDAGDPVEETERVKKMKHEEIVAELTARGESTDGSLTQLRKKLILSLLRERLSAEKAQ